MDFLIIGAGINGMLLARELAAENAQVLLLEMGECCREASWAGGGIVSPLYPWRYRQSVTALASWAQDFYPRLAEDLLVSTGIDPELCRTGLLMLDADDEDLALRWAAVNRRPMERVGPTFIYDREPGLGEGFEKGLWMPEVANIRNPRLGQALLMDLNSRPNVTVREHSPVVRIHSSGEHIENVVVQNEGAARRYQADRVILCAGAWTGILAEQLDLKLPVEPVKGQMLLYRPASLPVKSIVLTAGRYVIPRRDGHLLVGSTLEYEGFDKRVTPEARTSLQQSAERLVPCLRGSEPVTQWAGLRPAASEGVPYIGKLPGYDNLFVNAGQFRNGLVLAPASARLLADILLGREAIVDPVPYSPREGRLSAGK
jgi:glycine oxidase